MLNSNPLADTTALQACNRLVNHSSYGAVFFAIDDACTAGAVQEDAGVDKVEVVAQGHEAEGAFGIDEVVDGSEDGFGGVKAFVYEACVTDCADVVSCEDALGGLHCGGGARVRGVGGGAGGGEGAEDGGLKGEGVGVEAEVVCVGCEHRTCIDVCLVGLQRMYVP